MEGEERSLPPSVDVVVAGAGPVGLCLALALAKKGRSVLVLEKEPTLAKESRAPGVWCRTQEILAALGVLDRFLARGIPLDALTLYDAARGDESLLSFPIHELRGETSEPRLLVIPQDETERLLYEALVAETTAQVVFGAEVSGFTQRTADVVVAYQAKDGARTVTARYLAGCDGAHSTVRSLLGLRLEGKTYRQEVALADVRIAGSNDRPFPRIAPGRPMALAIRIDDELWRMILPYAQGEALPLDERIPKAARALFGAVPYELVWKSEFRLHQRMSPAFVRGRVALAGDAAHLNSPVGGQGMNAGLHDAEALAKALDEALGSDDPSRLARYEARRRRRVATGVNRFTDVLTKVVFTREGTLIRPLLRTVRQALKVAPLRMALMRRLAMITDSRDDPA